jgi:hypothetical protein
MKRIVLLFLLLITLPCLSQRNEVVIARRRVTSTPPSGVSYIANSAAQCYNVSGSSPTCALGSAVGTGGTIYVSFGLESSNGFIPSSITDNCGGTNTYTKDVQKTGFNITAAISLWHRTNQVASNCASPVVTVVIGADPSSHFNGINVMAVTGANATTPTQTSGCHEDFVNTTSLTAAALITSATELVWVASVAELNRDWSAGTGYTILPTNTANRITGHEYQSGVASGTFTPAITVSVSTTGETCAVGIQP